MSVDLKDKYREETNKDVYSEDNVYGGSGGSYSDQYVKWLEKQVKNNDLLHSVSGTSRVDLVEMWRNYSSDLFAKRMFKGETHPITEDESFEIMMKILNDYR